MALEHRRRGTGTKEEVSKVVSDSPPNFAIGAAVETIAGHAIPCVALEKSSLGLAAVSRSLLFPAVQVNLAHDCISLQFRAGVVAASDPVWQRASLFRPRRGVTCRIVETCSNRDNRLGN